MSTSATYSISQLAAEFGITTRAIRFYEEKKLLSPARNGSSRIYSAADRVQLKLILRGKRLGLTLEESHDIIALYDPAHGNVEQLQKVMAKFRDKRSQFERQRQELDELIVDLRQAEAKCLEALQKSAPTHRQQRSV